MDKLRIPKVSVIIVNYNYGHFIEAAYESVKAQTYPNVEIIMVDDKSTDDSTASIDRIIAKDEEVTAVKLPVNVGQTIASLRGLEKAGGAYVVFVDSDDQLMPACIEAHMYAQLSSRIPVALTSVDILNSVNGQDVNLSHAGFAEYIESGRGRRPSAIRPIETSVPGSWFSKHAPIVRPEQLHFVLPPQVDPWVWAPSSGNCYRADAARILLREGALDGLKWGTDTYLARPLSALFGSIIIDAPLMRYVTHTTNIFTKGAPLYNFLVFDPGPENAEATALTKAAVRLLLADASVASRYANAALFFDAIKALCDVWPGVDPDDGSSDFFSAQLVANRASLISGFGKEAVDQEFRRRRLHAGLISRIARAQRRQT